MYKIKIKKKVKRARIFMYVYIIHLLPWKKGCRMQERGRVGRIGRVKDVCINLWSICWITNKHNKKEGEIIQVNFSTRIQKKNTSFISRCLFIIHYTKKKPSHHNFVSNFYFISLFFYSVLFYILKLILFIMFYPTFICYSFICFEQLLFILYFSI